MKGVAVLVAALLLGAATGELLCRWPPFRDLAGRVSARGGLVNVVNGKGIYESDLGGDEQVTAADATLAANLRRAAAPGRVDSSSVDAELALLHAQFGDEKLFERALRSTGMAESVLRENLEEQKRESNWLEGQLAGDRAATTEENRKFYDSHADLFAQPVRYRAAHLFLAAHAETPPEVVAEKEAAIAELEKRLQQGEPFSALAAEASEDKATKNRGGDLGYFSETPVPAELIAELKKLQPGQTSRPFRSHLGFHIVQLTEIKPARVLSFEEVRGEVSLMLANERRANSVQRIAREISAFASR